MLSRFQVYVCILAGWPRTGGGWLSDLPNLRPCLPAYCCLLVRVCGCLCVVSEWQLRGSVPVLVPVLGALPSAVRRMFAGGMTAAVASPTAFFCYRVIFPPCLGGAIVLRLRCMVVGSCYTRRRVWWVRTRT